MCVSLVSEISVPAPKILVRGEAESESEAIIENAVVEVEEFQHI